jgi:molecular chaperone GrpE
MTETRKPETETEETANAGARASEAGATEAGQELDPIEALQAENAELKDRMLRTMAEMENLRRRTEKELSEGRQYAVSSFARDMLGVGDNLRRALETVSDEARAAANEALGALIEGVEMTERDLLNQLEKHGVKKVDPAGEKFDPNYHQAMFEVPNPDVPNNTVVQVMQAVFKIGERVLRPAMVGVSKGGPKERKSDAGAAPGATVDKTA